MIFWYFIEAPQFHYEILNYYLLTKNMIKFEKKYENEQLQEHIMQYCIAEITISNFVNFTVFADFVVFVVLCIFSP